MSVQLPIRVEPARAACSNSKLQILQSRHGAPAKDELAKDLGDHRTFRVASAGLTRPPVSEKS